MNRRPPKESAVVNRILSYLNGLPQCKAIKIHGAVFGRAGEPDILVCYEGWFVALEVKRPGSAGNTTPLQEAALEAWRKAYGVAGVVTSVEEVRVLLAVVEDRLQRYRQMMEASA